MKRKERDWVVIVSCLVKEEPQEGQPDSFKIIDAGRAEKAKDAEKASWKAVKAIWAEAAKRKEIQPICGVRAVTKADFDEAVKRTQSELAAKQEAAKNEEKKEAETNTEATGQTETESGNKDNVGEQEGRTSRV